MENQYEIKGNNLPTSAIKFNKVAISELVTMDPITGEFKPKGTSCIILTGEDISEGIMVTCKIHYDIKSGVYTVLSHRMEQL